ncbi:hypothetical protein [Plantactinospora sp. DSM 117369]
MNSASGDIVVDGVQGGVRCAGIALVGYIWSRMLFRRDPSK